MSSILKVNTLQDAGGNAILTSDGSGNLTTLKTNYPAFEAFLSSDQNLTDNTYVKIQFDTKVFDTNNCYDNTTNHRFLPTVAGKYSVYGAIEGDVEGTNKMYRVILAIYKNGSSVARIYHYPGTNAPQNNQSLNVTRTIDMNGTTDYLEIFGYVDAVGSNQARVDSSSTDLRTYFGAYRIGD